VIPLPVVHVKDVANAHVAALTSAIPPLRRVLMVSAVTSALEVSRYLAADFRPLGYPCISRRMPSAIVPVAKVRGGDAGLGGDSMGPAQGCRGLVLSRVGKMPYDDGGDNEEEDGDDGDGVDADDDGDDNHHDLGGEGCEITGVMLRAVLGLAAVGPCRDRRFWAHLRQQPVARVPRLQVRTCQHQPKNACWRWRLLAFSQYNLSSACPFYRTVLTRWWLCYVYGRYEHDMMQAFEDMAHEAIERGLVPTTRVSPLVDNQCWRALVSDRAQ
jgi:hypothetical protein